MATAATGWGAVCTASITTQTETTATITVTSYWQNLSWDYNINNVSSTVYCGGDSYKVLNAGSVNSTGAGTSGKVSLGSHSFTVNKTTAEQSINCYSQIVAASSYVSGTKNSAKVSVTVPAKTSYTVSYNANGGSGAPSAQTKWHGTALTLSTTKPTRTGYTFAGWATSSSGSVAYAAGASYTANANVTLYAKWTAITYTVSYNANGGSGAPANQTKTHGVNLTLSSTKPTRTNYNFKGWGTSASSTTVAYGVGATYSTNAAITLYAIWELAYVKPRITGLSVSRCNSNGTVSDEGTYALVNFNWSCDKTVSTIVIEWKISTEYSYANSSTISASGTSNSVRAIVGAGTLSTDNTYDIHVTVSDSSGNTSATETLQGTEFPIDFKKDSNGIGVSLGKPAETTNLFECKYPAQFNNGVYDLVMRSKENSAEILAKDGSLHMFPNASSSWARGIISYTQDKQTPISEMGFYGNGDSIRYLYLGKTYADSFARFINNYTAAIGYHRFNAGWHGFFGSHDNACNSSSRLGWVGYDISGGDKHLYLYNDTTGGSVVLRNSSLWLYFATDRLRVLTNDAAYLGDSNYKWKAVYAVNGTIQTSDRNQKENIVEIGEKYEELFKRLKPVTFELKGNEHDRTHIGLIAQDVKEAMDIIGLTPKDLAAYCMDYKTEYDEETGEDEVVLDEDGKPIELYSLRYSEFIALNTHMIQKQQAEIEAQRKEIDSLKAEIEALKELVKGTLS